jgi:hypothetical protein
MKVGKYFRMTVLTNFKPRFHYSQEVRKLRKTEVKIPDYAVQFVTVHLDRSPDRYGSFLFSHELRLSPLGTATTVRFIVPCTNPRR